MPRQIVVDTETTGLSAESGDRIIELGCVELRARRPTGRNLHLYFNPQRSSHPDALRIHGIRDEFLQDKPLFAAQAAHIRAYLSGAQLIIHNAAFDLGFLEHEMRLAQQPPLAECTAEVIDTLALAKRLFPGRRNTLDALCDRLEIDRSTRTLHGALLDAQLLAQVYLQLTRKQESLLPAGGPGAANNTQGAAARGIDLRAFKLPVLRASAQEAAEHAQILAQIDQAAGGQALWRGFEPARESRTPKNKNK